MTYVAPPSSKKNAVATTTTTTITAGAVTIPVADTSICYDVSGALITAGYVLRSPSSLTSPPPEEITITGCSNAYGVGGAGNLTGVARSVNYDANTGGVAQGAAYAWPSGTVVSVMLSIGVYNILAADIAAHQAALLAMQPIGIEYNYTAAQPSPTLRVIDINGNTIANPSVYLAANPLFAKIQRCNLSNAGVVTAWYGQTNFSYTGSNGQVVVYFPEGWYMQQIITTPTTNLIRRWVSPVAWPGFRPHPAFISNGKELGQFYIGAFPGSAFNNAAAATELDTITITAGCSTNGNLTITLDGNYAFTVPVTTTQNTAALVAAQIIAAGNQTDYMGVVWTVGGSGTTVTYTPSVPGLKTTVAIAVASTGVTASVAKTTSGAGGPAELDTVTFTAGCSTNGNITINLDGEPAFTVALTTAAQGTAALVATAIYTAKNSFPGLFGGSVWTIANPSSGVLTFSQNFPGPVIPVTVSYGSTGVTGGVVQTTVGAQGYVLNDSSGVNFAADMLSSVAGVKPMTGWTNSTATQTNFRALAQNRGPGWNLASFNQISWVELLYAIQYGSFYSQSVLSAGVTSITDDTITNMAVPNGYTAGVNSGAITGASDLGNASGQVTINHYQTAQSTKPMSLFGIENFYGNTYWWADGLKIFNNIPWIADNNFNDTVMQTFTATASSSSLSYSGVPTFYVGQPVMFMNIGGALPSGLLPGVQYYVITATSSVFTVSTILGGAAIVMGTTGSGTNCVMPNTLKNYINQGITLLATTDYPTEIANSEIFDYGFLAALGGGSSSTGLTDYYYQASGAMSACFGGNWSNSAYAGAFLWSLSNPASTVSRKVGARLAFFG